MAVTVSTQLYPAGTDLYRLAASLYGDANGVTLILNANGLLDPILSEDANLVIPIYNAALVNGGIPVSS
jgi:hypothetical protein